MKSYSKFLLIIAGLLLIWGTQDLFDYFNFGINTIQQFLGTGAEATIKEMVYGNLKNGAIKILLSVVIFVFSLIKARINKTYK